jgi:hypothetical protein
VHNHLKVAKRARNRVRKLVSEQCQLRTDVATLSTSLQCQKIAQELEKTQSINTLSQLKKSRKKWQDRARAAKESRRYMLAKKPRSKRTSQTKINGAYSQKIRSLSRKLVMAGVSAVQVPKIIQMCAQAFGIDPGPLPGPRSVGRFVFEGGVAAKIQACSILSEAQGTFPTVSL